MPSVCTFDYVFYTETQVMGYILLIDITLSYTTVRVKHSSVCEDYMSVSVNKVSDMVHGDTPLTSSVVQCHDLTTYTGTARDLDSLVGISVLTV